MWIARDKDGSLWLHKTKPYKLDDYWYNEGDVSDIALEKDWFPEVKWKDEEPRELILK